MSVQNDLLCHAAERARRGDRVARAPCWPAPRTRPTRPAKSSATGRPSPRSRRTGPRSASRRTASSVARA